MFLEYARLKGYIGLKRGSNIDEIELPFYKMKSNICFIVGNNGSGKSTIKKALNQYIDSADNFIPGVVGEKELKYLLDDGTRYHINIIHGIKENTKERMSAKAFIKKILPDGTEINLNPNGNIGSYKSVVEDVFELDPNFLSLISLGCEEKGLAVKTPSERKKIVSERLDSVEVYNDIGRVITKRCNTRQAIINSITAKINSIGDLELLKSTIVNKEALLNNLTISKENLQSEKSKLELIVDQLDPDKTILNRYNELVEKYKLFLSQMPDKISLSELDSAVIQLQDNLVQLKLKKAEYDKEMYHVDSILPNLLAEHEENSKMIQLKTSRLSSLESGSNYDSIKSTYDMTVINIKEYDRIFNEMGITNPMSISKDEYIIGLDTLIEIKESLCSIDSSVTDSIMKSALEYVKIGTLPSIKELNDMLSMKTNNIHELKLKLVELDNKINRMDVLSNRPTACNIDTCFFIKEAVDIAKSNPVEEKERVISEIENLTKEISQINESIINTEDLCNTVQYLLNVKRNIDKNYNILIKLPKGDKFTDLSYFIEDVLHGSIFIGMIDKIYDTIRFANIFDEYRNSKELLTTLEADIKLYESKVDIIEEIQNDLSELKEKADSMISKLDEIYNRKQLIRFNLDEVDAEINKVVAEIDKYNKCKSMVEESDKIQKELESLSKDSDKIKQCISRINQILQEISSIESQMSPIKSDIIDRKYRIKLTEDYKVELESSLKSINILEIIKKHSVPKTGIQIIFMKLYFGTIIEIANDILSNFFDSALILTDYDITDNEFYISCYDKRSGLSNKDISSCSESEKCIIGLALGFGFMFQSSSVYNIPLLDEIDGGLDSDNRISFIPTINGIMIQRKMRQIILISHSSETSIDNCDSILLRLPNRKLSENYGNVIADYS